MKRLPAAFWLIAPLAWLALVTALAPGIIAMLRRPETSFAEAVALVGIAFASSIIWLGGIRHLALWAVAAVRSPARNLAPARLDARVALLYCTADDFTADTLRATMGQEHPVATFILDDSVTSQSRLAVDGFALQTGAEVLRRPHRTGFKAGNLNFALDRLRDRFDYFVIVDSDVALHPSFVTRALRNFASDPRVGIVQGRHVARAGSTRFSQSLAGMLESHVAVVQGGRSKVGLSVFMGRSAMISAACIRAVGRLPEIVTEDVALSVEAREAGFTIAFDPQLVGEEDFPVDFHAFRTQYAKTVEGTTEFLGEYWWRIVRSKLLLREKVDVLVEQLVTPAMGIAGLVFVASGLVLAQQGGHANQPWWVIAATAVCGVAALLPETVRAVRTRGLVPGIRFLATASALYASTMVLTVRCIAKVAFGGRAVFAVTPKVARPGSLRSGIRSLVHELAAAATVTGLAIAVSGSLISAVPLLSSAGAAILFVILGTRESERGMSRSWADRDNDSSRAVSA